MNLNEQSSGSSTDRSLVANVKHIGFRVRLSYECSSTQSSTESPGEALLLPRGISAIQSHIKKDGHVVTWKICTRLLDSPPSKKICEHIDLIWFQIHPWQNDIHLGKDNLITVHIYLIAYQTKICTTKHLIDYNVLKSKKSYFFVWHPKIPDWTRWHTMKK